MVVHIILNRLLSLFELGLAVIKPNEPFFEHNRQSTNLFDLILNSPLPILLHTPSPSSVPSPTSTLEVPSIPFHSAGIF